MSSLAIPQQDSHHGPDHSQEAEIQRQLVLDLYERSRLAIVTMLVLIGVIRWAIDPAYRVDGEVRLAFAILIAVNLARFALAMVSRERRERLASVRAQLIAFTVGVGLSSVTLGVLVVLSWPSLDPARIAIVAVRGWCRAR